jgi:hypothetical protein
MWLTAPVSLPTTSLRVPAVERRERLSEAELSEEETNVVSLVALGSRVIVPRNKLLIIIFNISLAKFRRPSPAEGAKHLLLTEELSEISLHLLSGIFAAQLVLIDDVLEIDVSGHGVSGGHQVVVVHSLHERLHL